MAVSRKSWAVRSHWAQRAQSRQEHGRKNGYRSGLEDENAKLIERLGYPVLFEAIKIPYVIPEKSHTYTPDFVLPNGIIVETKGLFEPADRAKHVLIKAQYPELDIRFVFQRPTDALYKGSPTSYGEWATKHGFLWATKLIPRDWFTEPGPEARPEVILSLPPLRLK